MKHIFRTFLVSKQVIIVIASILIVTASLNGGPVFAHAKLVKSEPPQRAALSVPPAYVQLWFNEEIEVPFSSIAVLDENKHSITVESPEAVEADLKSVILSLPELIPGQYTVEYRILSMDGHVVESKFNFTLKNSAHEK